MRRSVYERDLKRPFEKHEPDEITSDELRRLCDHIVERGAPATGVHAREVVMLVFRCRDRGETVANLVDEARPCLIATFQPRDRALAGEEFGLLYRYLERVACGPTCALPSSCCCL